MRSHATRLKLDFNAGHAAVVGISLTDTANAASALDKQVAPHARAFCVVLLLLAT